MATFAGICTITNLINNKMYVGYSNNCSKRKHNHFKSLMSNTHWNLRLQNAYNKYGKENFVFEILEFWNKEYLASQENYWCNMLNTHDRRYGYNIQPTNPYNSIKHSPETIEKIKKANIGKKWTESQRQKMIIASTGKIVSKETREKLRNNMIGKKLSLETIAKMKESKKKSNYRHSEETRKKISAANLTPEKILINKENAKIAQAANIGRNHSKESKIKMVKKRFGECKKILIFDKLGNFIQECDLSKEASQITGVKRSAISNNLCGLSKSCTNYTFKYK